MTRGLTRIRVLSIAAAVCGLSFFGIYADSQAHPVSERYPDYWHADHHTDQHITWRFAPNFPDGGDKKARVREAFNVWNAKNQKMEFENLPDATSGYTIGCNDPPYHGVFYGSIDGQGGTLAETLTCAHQNTSIIHNFAMKVDEAELWFDEAGNGPNDKHDFGGLATHEVGHATGFEGEFYPEWDVCLGTEPHTMCTNIGKTRYGMRSLEPHDWDAFDERYPNE